MSFMHNFKLVNCDTDSIMICKTDFAPFLINERQDLLKEINSIFPTNIKWEDDGYYFNVICLASKNYVLKSEDGKIKYKGSALKSSKTEPALREFLYAIIQTILDEKYDYKQIYQTYIDEILAVKDIKRWASKKTLSQTTYQSDRANETKIINAIKGTEYKEGDRIFCYFAIDGNLKLVENYNNDHDIPRLLKKLFTTAKIFDSIIEKDTFINFGLVKNLKLLGLK